MIVISLAHVSLSLQSDPSARLNCLNRNGQPFDLFHVAFSVSYDNHHLSFLSVHNLSASSTALHLLLIYIHVHVCSWCASFLFPLHSACKITFNLKFRLYDSGTLNWRTTHSLLHIECVGCANQRYGEIIGQ